MNIPLVNLKKNYETYRADYDRILVEAASSCAYILGKYVEEFESKFAAYLGVKHVIGVGNGTDALTLILKGMGLPAGSTILTQPNTFIATALAIRNAGHNFALADVNPDTFSLDLESYVGPDPAAMLPVHLYGMPFDADAYHAGMPGIPLVEDACQAHGANLRRRKCGSLGLASAFSFYPGKNLGAFGDGGAVATNDDALAGEIRALRNWGGAQKYIHDHDGGNSRLDGLQAAILTYKLGHLDAWNARRNELAARYLRNLEGCPGLKLPVSAPEGSLHCWHLFVVQVDPARRDELLKKLAEAGVFGGIHYPRPIHKQKVYASLPVARLKLPVAEALADSIFSLPLFPDMTDEECDFVSGTLRGLLTQPA